MMMSIGLCVGKEFFEATKFGSMDEMMSIGLYVGKEFFEATKFGSMFDGDSVYVDGGSVPFSENRNLVCGNK